MAQRATKATQHKTKTITTRILSNYITSNNTVHKALDSSNNNGSGSDSDINCGSATTTTTK